MSRYHNPKVRFFSNQQRGAVMVIVGLMVVVLCLITALGMETFRLLTSRIQMQNIAEYVAEVSLSEIRSASQSINIARIDAIVNSNYFLAQGESLTRTGAIDARAGCYNPDSATFRAVTPATCSAPELQAVYVRISTANSAVTKMLAQLFFAARIDIAARAISYWYDSGAGGSYYVTGPFTGIVS
jgi:Flp pilus assembly protein TadG